MSYSRSLLTAALIAAPTSLRAQVLLVTSPLAEKESAKGETYAARIVITNPTAFPQSVRVYQTDTGGTTRSNAKWVTLQAQKIVVPARAEATVPYTVRVPQDDSLRGTYWSQIVLEGPRTATGVQVVTHLGATGTRTISIEKPVAGHDSTGSATLEFDVIVTGERAVRPMFSAELYDSAGVLRAKAAQTRGLVPPGATIRQRFDFARLPAGTYKVMVFTDTGAEHVFASQFTIVF